MLDPGPALVRRWASEWLGAADPRVGEAILDPGYAIAISGQVLEGRERYMAATLEQLGRFPGLGLIVHALLRSGERIAVRFTQHGASARHEGRLAAWAGIALFTTDGRRLTACWAEEDYLARRRQLDTGRVDQIPPPAPAPWTTPSTEPDPGAPEAVRDWLAAPRLDAAALQDDGGAGAVMIDGAVTHVNAILGAGPRVAFHARREGIYRGGLPGVDDAVAVGRSAALHLAGIVEVADGRVRGGHVVADRLGLARSLRAG